MNNNKNNNEGSHWSDPNCVLCSWVPDLDTGKGNTTDRICRRCRKSDMATSARRIREPRAFYLKRAESCEALARSGTEDDIAPFSRLMWWRMALRWRLTALRGFRWIPDTRTVVVLRPRRKAKTPAASKDRGVGSVDRRTKKRGRRS